VQAGKPAPAAAPVPGANPWEGKDPAKAAAWAKLSPQVQKKIGMADPTDSIIVGRMAKGEFGGLFGGGATDANPDGTANQATQVAQASTAANTQVDASLARFKELLAKAAGPAAAQSAKVPADDAAKNPVGNTNASTAIPTGGLENPANQVKESTSYFLEKLRLLESTQVNEELSPEESAELDKLAQSYGDSEDPAIMALMKQYSDVKNAAIKAAPGPTNQAAKVPVNRDSMSFGQAFADARAKGEKQFTWKGKPYTTELAKPTTAGTPPAQSTIPTKTAPPKAGPPAELQKSNPADLMTGRDAAGKPVMKGSPADVTSKVPLNNPIEMPALPKRESVTFSNDVGSLARIVDLARR
jgi:hypothetical protein